jgi:hypothetical protein
MKIVASGDQAASCRSNASSLTFSGYSLSIGTQQPTQKCPIWPRDQDTWDIALCELLHCISDRRIRSVCSRTWSHDRFHCAIRITGQFAFSQQTKDDLILVHHDASIPSSPFYTLLHVANPFPRTAARNFPTHYFTDMGYWWIRAFHRQTVCEPVRFTCRVVVNLGETKCFKPPRGSGAQVSLMVIAVHDDWLILEETTSRFRV